jgi:thiol-disulfide isomerase/thioredoxin
MEIQKKPIFYLMILILVTIAGYLIYDNIISSKPNGVIGIQQGNTLLDQTIPNINGSGSVSFSDYRGSVLIIDFMAPWCPPCRDQVPILGQVESIEGVEVITINVDPSYEMESLINFGKEEDIHWFFGHSPSSALNFEVSAIPTVLVVDKDGKIVNRAFFTSIKDFELILLPLID